MNEENNNQQTQENTQESNQADLAVQLQDCLAQKDEWKDRFLRTAAEFENYKKRSEKERAMWIANAQSSLLQDLIEVVDDFDRAFTLRSSDAQQALAGFELIYKSLQKLLEKYGVSEMKTVEHFDPTMHEAIMQVESSDHKPGDIVQVLQKGYMFKGNVLRPAKVSVAK